MTELFFRAPFTYFVQNDAKPNAIRIGTAQRPLDRVRQLKALSQTPLRLVGLVRAYAVFPRLIHDRFCVLREDWFMPEQPLLALIAALRAREPEQLLTAGEAREIFVRVFPDDPARGIGLYQVAEDVIASTRRRGRKPLGRFDCQVLSR